MYETKFFIGLDVHSKSTDYVVRSWHGDVVLEGTCATSYRDLKEHLQVYFHSCVVGIEACNFFYAVREGFLQDGVPVRVANVLRIRSLVATNDRLDAARLSDMLRLGSFPESHIPGKVVQELRDLVVLRHSFLQECNKAQSRIWALLARRGIRILQRSLFSQKGFFLVKKAAKGDVNLQFLILHYETLKERLGQATKNLTTYAQKHFPIEWQKLQEIAGIGPIVTSYLLAEIHPISRFSSEKKLRRYAGVVPVTQDSAGKSYGNRIPKSSSRVLLRWALVQAAHGAIKKKDSSLQEYYKIKKKTKSKGAIMCIARAVSDKVYTTLRSCSQQV